MSDLIQIGFDYGALPSDVALKAQLAANSIKLRLKRTVEDIIEIGRELTAVKDELPHGQFLPWIAAEFEMTKDTAQNFMSVFDRFGKNGNFPFLNLKPSILYALAAPSTPEAVIDKAVAKAESGDKVTVADVKDWKALEAKLESERQAREIAERRNIEWQAQSKADRDKLRQAEYQIDLLKAQPAPAPVVVERIVAPDDYETAKAAAEKLRTNIDAMRKRQDELVQQQVAAKLRERERELESLERQAKQAEIRLTSLNKQIDSYSSIERMTRLQRDQIEKCRSMLAELAANMEGFDRLENDPKTDQLWDALADMMQNGVMAIRFFRGNHVGALA